ncbi:MAG: histidine kinase [Saprospiraceae bacterium]|nr:histidine kinase [Saprospiraceae bacterium]
MKKLLTVWLHVAFWGMVLWVMTQSLSIESVEIIIENGVERRVVSRNYLITIPILISLAAKAVLAYGHALWAFPKAFLKRDWVTYTGCLLILFGVSFGLEFLLIELYQWQYPRRTFTFLNSLPLNLLINLIALGLSFGYAFARHHQQTERARRQLEQEKLATELNFLKAQINPHFLFNTLNNLFAMAEVRGNTELSHGIAQLSQLMRYMIDHGKSGRVPLRKELDCLQSVIDIQSLRYDPQDDFAVAYDLQGDPGNAQIAPLILIPFVENAFKHGVRAGHPSFIRIAMRIDGQRLHCTISNSVHPGVETISEGTGIGLANVRRRLELIYPDRYQLEISETDEVYSVVLDLDLHT